MRLKRKHIKLVCFLLISNAMYSQPSFGSYVNGLFFNIFSNKPDSQVTAFLEEHVPVDMNPPEVEGSWTAYPDRIPAFTEMAHSYFFSKHPFIKAAFRRGEFKVFTNVSTDSGYSGVSIRDVALLISFDDPKDASDLFDKIRKDLIAYGGNESFSEDPIRKMAVFFGRESDGIAPGKVRVCLVNRGDYDSEKHQLIIDMFGG